MYYDNGIRLDKLENGKSDYSKNQITDSTGKKYRLDFISEKDKTGKGGNSSVFKLLNKDGSSDKVIKFCNFSRPGSGASGSYRKKYGRFIREIQVLKELKDQNIQNIVVIIDDGMEDIEGYNHPYYIMEKADTDLSDYIISNYPDIDIQTKLTLFYEIVKSLKSLHDMNYYHRDIKPDNIFMFQEGEGDEVKYVWKVGDLGLVGERSKNWDYKGEKIGPFGWLSPEAMNKYLTEEASLGFDCTIDFKSDVFQLGKLFWFIIQGNCPIGQLNPADLIKGEPVKDEVFKLIFEMLHYNKATRIPLNNVVAGLDAMKTAVPF